MAEWEMDDLVELRIRGEFVDVVGLVTTMTVAVIDSGENSRATRAAHDLADQAKSQINFGLAERQLKRIVREDEEYDFRGLDVRVHEFDPRHPDEESELDVNTLPPFEEANAYGIVMEDDEGMHMAGHPDELDMETGLQLASTLRMFAREIEKEASEKGMEEV